jgi:hypothetical protein
MAEPERQPFAQNSFFRRANSWRYAPPIDFYFHMGNPPIRTTARLLFLQVDICRIEVPKITRVDRPYLSPDAHYGHHQICFELSI